MHSTLSHVLTACYHTFLPHSAAPLPHSAAPLPHFAAPLQPSRRQVADALALKADLAGVDLTLSQMRQEISDLNVGVSRRAEVGRVEEVSRGGADGWCGGGGQ